MKNILTRAALTSILAGAAFAGTANAQGFLGSEPAEPSFYISGFIGGGFPTDAGFEGVQTPDPAIPGTVGGSVAGANALVDLEFDNDIYFGGAIGYQLPFQFWGIFHPRIELEVSYIESDVDSGSFNGGNQTFSGDQSTLYVFANNFTDIKWSENQLLVPYIGGGLGVGIVDTEVEYFPVGAPFAPAPAFALTGEDTGFATHTTLGVSFKPAANYEIYTEGRYLTVYDVDVERRFQGGGTTDLFNADLDDKLDSFSITAGARYRF